MYADTVVVRGHPIEDSFDTSEVAFVFQTKGERGDIALAENASRLAAGDDVVVEYLPVDVSWNAATGLGVPGSD